MSPRHRRHNSDFLVVLEFERRIEVSQCCGLDSMTHKLRFTPCKPSLPKSKHDTECFIHVSKWLDCTILTHQLLAHAIGSKDTMPVIHAVSTWSYSQTVHARPSAAVHSHLSLSTNEAGYLSKHFCTLEENQGGAALLNTCFLPRYVFSSSMRD